MAYVKPDAVVEQMVQAGVNKSRLPVRDLLVRGFLSGALLGFATTLAFTASLQTRVGLVGALVFPVGFVMIVLLGLELVTGNFALVPLAVREGRVSLGALLANWSWVFLGNLIGSVFYALLFTATLPADSEMARQLMTVAEAKTLGYERLAGRGLAMAVGKAVLCNWMVTLGVVMALTSQSTSGKIVAMWLPIMTFFAQGFEHSVVNMFVIPAGMLLGARVGLGDWWLWNQIPVTLGNVFGGLVFTGLALHATHGRALARETPRPTAVALGGEMHGALANRP
ncbi:MAG TPA: formate/nitrite transporter family protein [Methylomirabilota bacterium]|nr:formate/nitrite transporter family protein [Methylomirabilota bacterium]